MYSFSNWIVSFRQQLLNEVFNEKVVDKISTGISKEQIEIAADNVDKTSKSFAKKRDLLADRLGVNYYAIFSGDSEEVPLKNYSTRLDLWKDGVSKLQRWAQYSKIRKTCINSTASPIVEIIDSDLLESEDIIPCFEGNFADYLLRCAFVERPVLTNFVGDLHEKKINNFMNLDRELITQNRQRLAYLLYQNQPHLTGGVSQNSEAGILQGEFNRKRRHMPIRKLMSLTGGLIQKIKPCFMMSPLSIAQFLDPKTSRFDVIVFDEASQVKPEDALGALLRGNQAAVIGDTRQLPPTSFFDHIIESDENEDPENIAPVSDIESILHLCKISFPSKTLRWHYRSRHESLIAVSNQEFYDNRLVIYPSPINNTEHLGLKLIHSPNTVYDRGKSSVNRMEAKIVTKAALEHYQKYPDKSLGIGTFNIKQQQAILEEVEQQIREHPEMEEFFKMNKNEHFFVKNLETIQGDERDVIFLSIGFGFDESKRLTHNFGPLNQDGGERRLNVLISRARERCVVFSNFKAGDLSIDANASFGLRALKVFLDYAENRKLHIIESKGEDTDSPFEDSVYEFLRDHGYDVRKQVGCGGYRVDLAIVSAEFPGRYILGIECDGAKYHSSPVARDRDRLRQQILEGLGWNLYRVWSTDWYRNRAETSRRLLYAVEKAKKLGNIPPKAIQKQNPLVKEIQNEIKREENPGKNAQDKTLDDFVPDYEICPSLEINSQVGLDEMPVDQLARVFIKVVDFEGPVHFDEVVRRIRSHRGLKRTGNKILDAISRAATFAESNKAVIRRGNFYWSANNQIVRVRRRCGDTSVKIELICNEEIAETIKLVLKHQFATQQDDLIVKSSRVLGFKATSEAVTERIKTVIENLVSQSKLYHLSNGMIDLNAISYNIELSDGKKLNDIKKTLKTNNKEDEDGINIHLENGIDIYKLTLICPICKKTFDYLFDKRKGYIFKTECPHCGISLDGTGKATKCWRCEYCSEKFQTKNESERHEEKCKFRPNK
jgi:very-short-patch-repair endonuclease